MPPLEEPPERLPPTGDLLPVVCVVDDIDVPPVTGVKELPVLPEMGVD